jgi:hypothetical protein
LAEANSRFFAGARAPQFVLFQMQPVDQRPPTLEDSQALLEVLHRYVPVLVEKGYLLLERSENNAHKPAPLARRFLRRQLIRIGEEVALDPAQEHPQLLSLEISYSRKGKLRKTLYKAPLLFLRVRTDYGGALTYRLIPGMARSGFLISPTMETVRDLMEMYGTSAGKRAVSFSVLTDAAGMGCYQDNIVMTLQAVPHLACAAMSAEQLIRLDPPPFKTCPQEIQSKQLVRIAECEGKTVLVVHPDGQMRFSIRPGMRQVHGQFGLLPEAYQKGNSDGVQFVVEYQPTAGPTRVLFDRYLDPLEKSADRGFQALSVDLPEGCQGSLVFKTGNLSGKTTSWDWSFWTDIHIK